MDAATFRQVLIKAMKLNPDVNTAYFDKEDALLLALNYKNPPGRLLRRQWSQPVNVLPDISTWRKYIKEEGLKIASKCLNIPQHKVGLVRSNEKFCFPCDNSVIRIDKNQIGSRRFGTSVVIKDNLVFGIKEDQSRVNEKVEGDDELLNMESKKAGNLNCEFWLEFENETRMHINMLEKVEPMSHLIPLQTQEEEVVQGSLVVEPTLMEDEPVVDQQTADRGSLLSREKLGSAQDKEESIPQSKVNPGSEEETKAVQSPVVEKDEIAEPKKNEAM